MPPKCMEQQLDFGRYKGQSIDQVDEGYLQWMLIRLPKRSRWWSAAAAALAARGKAMSDTSCDNATRILDELKRCGNQRDLQWARRLHAKAAESGCVRNTYVAAAIIRALAKCGCMASARQVFDSFTNPTLECWNSLIQGYAGNGEGRAALKHFARMKAESGCTPNAFTYAAALKACASIAANGEKDEALNLGRGIHSEAGCCCVDPYVRSTLIDMYCKCSSMVDARRVFDDLQSPDVVAWSALLLGYADNGDGHAALGLFSRMKSTPGCVPNAVSYVAALKACASLAANGEKNIALMKGREIHSEIGHHCDPYVQSTLIGMYAKCGAMEYAQNAFNKLQRPDVVSWTALLFGYADNGDGATALELFSRMKSRSRTSRGCSPNAHTYVAVLKACTSLAANGGTMQALQYGRQIHLEIGCQLTLHLQNTLIDMYAKCRSMVEARRVFDCIRKPDVVSWNALLLGYADNGEAAVALDLFAAMKKNTRGACIPDAFTYVAVLKACTSLAANGEKQEAVKHGRAIHEEARCFFQQQQQNRKLQGTLIDMYAKCGSMVEAQSVFDSVHSPDVVSWTALLLGYADNGECGVALELFARMKKNSGCSPDAVTYIAALKSCASIGALALGRKIHSEMYDALFTPHVVTSLVDLYAKCGSMVDACEVYDSHARARKVPAVNALLAGFARSGQRGFVLNHFEALRDAGLQPDAATFVCILVCCSHAGLVDRAQECFFQVMQFGISPDASHLNCMVDILGRANRLSEAAAMVRVAAQRADAVTWMTLLAACVKRRDVRLGEWAFRSLVEMEKRQASAYVLMANLYASCGLREEQNKVLEMRRDHSLVRPYAV